MNRRESIRRVRRLPVRFSRLGSDQSYQGFTTNVSSSGVFISTNTVLPKGTRVRIEVCDPLHGFVVEGMVARTLRADSRLQGVMPSGMGVRFLTVDELVGELFPRASGAPAPAADGETAAEDAKPSPKRVRLDAYVVRFPSAASFRQSYERDVAQGGLFVATQYPAPVDRTVTLEIHPPEGPSFRLKARVVHCSPPVESQPGGEGGKPNLLSGMGVEFVDPQAAREAFEERL